MVGLTGAAVSRYLGRYITTLGLELDVEVEEKKAWV